MKLNVIIFGSTGMLGQSVLKECIENINVESVLLINRNSLNKNFNKTTEIIHDNFYDFSSLKDTFAGYNTCFFCLGISSLGLSENEYFKITYNIAVNAAETLIATQQNFTFCYVSGAGTDSSENGKIMWARVKGKLENKLLSMPFKAAYMFRPGFIQPVHGIKSRTKWYNILYTLFKPLYLILKPFKNAVTDSASFAKAMVFVALNGYEKKILSNADINKLAD